MLGIFPSIQSLRPHQKHFLEQFGYVQKRKSEWQFACQSFEWIDTKMVVKRRCLFLYTNYSRWECGPVSGLKTSQNENPFILHNVWPSRRMPRGQSNRFDTTTIKYYQTANINYFSHKDALSPCLLKAMHVQYVTKDENARLLVGADHLLVRWRPNIYMVSTQSNHNEVTQWKKDQWGIKTKASIFPSLRPE